ncbi:MAG: 2Fe-2S iron-sulfur cluster-binding protein [Nitrospinaceae bacterium]
MLDVYFEKQKRRVKVEPGANLREAAIAHRISIYPHIFKILNCRGRGLCSSCRVEIVSGRVSAPNEVETKNLKRAHRKKPDLRLACQIQVEDSLVVRTHV